jgi:hypothetical protein
MSKEALAKVVQRAISDAGFRRKLNSDPAGALKGFDLSGDEMSALRTGDAGRLSTLGIDQRMSKAFSLGGAVAATRMAQSDLSGSNATIVDDASGQGSRTVIPADPEQRGSIDVDGGTSATSTVRAGDDYKFAGRQAPDGGGSTSTVRAGDDYKFAGRVAPEGNSTVRVGDDWKFADRASAQSSVAPVEGSPEATAAENAAGSGRIGFARLDGSTVGASGGATSINDDPDGFLAASANRAAQGSVAPVEGSPEATAADIAEGGAVRASAIHDDPDGFLAANADAGGSVTRANVINDDPNGFLAANADAGGSVTRANVINDDPNGFLAANASSGTSGGSAGDGTAFLDESEAYLTKVGYDSSVNETKVTDAHDRTWSGDDIAGPSSDTSSSGTGNAGDPSDSGPSLDS